MLQIESRQFVREHGLLACIQCGKCTGGCPMAIKTKLNPRALIYRLLVASNGCDIEERVELWDCTTCNTCASRCPKQVNPMEAVIAMRSAFVEKGRVHPNVKTALESTFRHGNPLTFPREDRAVWADGLEIKPFEPGVEYLYFIGCSPSYDPRAQKVAQALVRLLKSSSVDFGFLGSEESCCGSEIRRLGEAGLFEMIVEETTAMYKELGVGKLFTTSPHCFNVFKNDYKTLPAGTQHPLDVQHYTQVLAGLVDDGALKFSTPVEKTVTYHDPCYLGKHNGVFDEPRRVLQSIPGVTLVEMDRSREKSLCCEGGGGRMWVEGTNMEERLAFQRVQEAVETGADVLAVACPFCLLTLEDAVKVKGLDDKLRVMDIMELVNLAL
jgi:Fe-S oxidoreductase